MGTFHETIPDSLIRWIVTQKVFWVATAPLSANGHVNVSPKGGQGGEFFGLVDNKTFWYMDLTGSGNETISHLHEPGNGRITIQLNAFEGPPKIVRLWGKGTVLENGSQVFDEFIFKHKISTIPGSRTIIVVDIHQVGSSCGFSVPYYEFKEFRTTLNDFFKKKDEKYKAGNEKESMDRYWAYKNAWSMDGLPGMNRGLAAGKAHNVEPIKKMVGPLAPTNYQNTRLRHSTGRLIFVCLLTFMLGMLLSLYAPRVMSFMLGSSQAKRQTLTWPLTNRVT